MTEYHVGQAVKVLGWTEDEPVAKGRIAKCPEIQMVGLDLGPETLVRKIKLKPGYQAVMCAGVLRFIEEECIRAI
jgi:hypothetical protein